MERHTCLDSRSCTVRPLDRRVTKLDQFSAFTDVTKLLRFPMATMKREDILLEAPGCRRELYPKPGVCPGGQGGP